MYGVAIQRGTRHIYFTDQDANRICVLEPLPASASSQAINTAKLAGGFGYTVHTVSGAEARQPVMLAFDEVDPNIFYFTDEVGLQRVTLGKKGGFYAVTRKTVVTRSSIQDRGSIYGVVMVPSGSHALLTVSELRGIVVAVDLKTGDVTVINNTPVVPPMGRLLGCCLHAAARTLYVTSYSDSMIFALSGLPVEWFLPPKA